MPQFRNRSIPRSVVGRSSRRTTTWFFSANVNVEAAVAANSAALSQTFNAAALALRPFTIVRTRGYIWAASDQAAAFEVPFGAVGFSVVSDQAAAIGVTAVPSPVADEGSELFFNFQGWIASGAGQAASQSNGSRLFEFDSKAQRKVSESEDLAVVIANASAADGAVVVLKFRMLVKLH